MYIKVNDERVIGMVLCMFCCFILCVDFLFFCGVYVRFCDFWVCLKCDFCFLLCFIFSFFLLCLCLCFLYIGILLLCIFCGRFFRFVDYGIVYKGLNFGLDDCGFIN